jgi:hypothetical protein
MTANRIKEIQDETAFPDSVSVCQALMKVWNECEQQQERMYSEEEVIAIVEKSRETGLTAEYLLLTEQFKKKI